MLPLDTYIQRQLLQHLGSIEETLGADLMAIISQIVPGLEHRVRDATELKKNRRPALAVILDTTGGVVEVVERIVGVFRHHYAEVTFIVPDRAMSAGTVLVMSGDRILMDYFSCLGPIDPQIQIEDDQGRVKLIPALSYLNQFERLRDRAARGQLTSAEYALLEKLDLAELHQFEQAKNLSVDLLKKWLSTYKFKNWDVTQTRGTPVTTQMKEQRAEEIAEDLSNNEKWHSHGRGIDMQTLREELNLRIEDFSEDEELAQTIREYFDLLRDYMVRQGLTSFVHTREYF
jgi:membrane-bound ClpP family serine protease